MTRTPDDQDDRPSLKTTLAVPGTLPDRATPPIIRLDLLLYTVAELPARFLLLETMDETPEIRTWSLHRLSLVEKYERYTE
jgi:hypothetical protein